MRSAAVRLKRRRPSAFCRITSAVPLAAAEGPRSFALSSSSSASCSRPRQPPPGACPLNNESCWRTRSASSSASFLARSRSCLTMSACNATVRLESRRTSALCLNTSRSRGSPDATSYKLRIFSSSSSASSKLMLPGGASARRSLSCSPTRFTRSLASRVVCSRSCLAMLTCMAERKQASRTASARAFMAAGPPGPPERTSASDRRFASRSLAICSRAAPTITPAPRRSASCRPAASAKSLASCFARSRSCFAMLTCKAACRPISRRSSDLCLTASSSHGASGDTSRKRRILASSSSTSLSNAALPPMWASPFNFAMCFLARSVSASSSFCARPRSCFAMFAFSVAFTLASLSASARCTTVSKSPTSPAEHSRNSRAFSSASSTSRASAAFPARIVSPFNSFSCASTPSINSLALRFACSRSSLNISTCRPTFRLVSRTQSRCCLNSPTSPGSRDMQAANPRTFSSRSVMSG
mmetsp:Transcript_8229/g.23553  ORF Transcript_8229/g.23553 Transcript_8229/m.23553 type:complete len:472 (-) Transcript_8229:855-2270(-)